MKKTLFPYFEDYFFKKEEYFQVFSEVDSRLEGWFKAELIMLFKHLQSKKVIDGFTREANYRGMTANQRYQVDFKVSIQNQVNLLEIKALCISQAANTPRNLQFYMRDDNLGIVKDFKKLNDIQVDNKWELAFIYPRPKLDDWQNNVSALPSLVNNWEPVTFPDNNCPDFLFLSLWKANK